MEPARGTANPVSARSRCFAHPPRNGAVVLFFLIPFAKPFMIHVVDAPFPSPESTHVEAA